MASQVRSGAAHRASAHVLIRTTEHDFDRSAKTPLTSSPGAPPSMRSASTGSCGGVLAQSGGPLNVSLT